MTPQAAYKLAHDGLAALFQGAAHTAQEVLSPPTEENKTLTAVYPVGVYGLPDTGFIIKAPIEADSLYHKLASVIENGDKKDKIFSDSA